MKYPETSNSISIITSSLKGPEEGAVTGPQKMGVCPIGGVAISREGARGLNAPNFLILFKFF